MLSMNLFVGIGRIVRDIEVKEIKPGLTVGRFTLALQRKIKTKEGIGKETCFIDCTVWNQQAIEAAGLKKGAEVFVKGFLKQDEWQDKKTGEKRSKHVIIVDSFVHNFALDSQVIDVENMFEPVAKQQQKQPIVNPRIQQKPQPVVEDDSFPEDLPF